MFLENNLIHYISIYPAPSHHLTWCSVTPHWQKLQTLLLSFRFRDNNWTLCNNYKKHVRWRVLNQFRSSTNIYGYELSTLLLFIIHF